MAVACEAFERLSRSERREYMRWLKDWHLQRRMAAVAARGGDTRRRVPPVMELASAMAQMDMRILSDR